MKSTTTSFTFRLAVLLASVGALGRASTLSDLAATADAVVVGTVNTRFESKNLVSFNISVLRALEGSALPNSVTIAHSWVGGAQGLPATFDVQITGIWFLSHSSSGAWDVIPCRPTSFFGSLYFPASANPPGGAYSYTAATPLVDVLAFEAAAGIQATQGSPVDLMGAISSGAASTPVILSTLVASPSTSFEAVGMAGMLLMNQAGALSVLSNVWPQLASEPNRVLIIPALRDEWRDTTPAGVAQLSSLVGSPTVTADLRAAAIRSLMATHTAASLPLFSQLLFGSNPTEKIEAAIAVSAFVNGCNIQTPATVASLGSLYCDNSTPYKSADTMANRIFGIGSQAEQASAIAYWQSWWTSHPEVQ